MQFVLLLRELDIVWTSLIIEWIRVIFVLTMAHLISKIWADFSCILDPRVK